MLYPFEPKRVTPAALEVRSARRRGRECATADRESSFMKAGYGEPRQLPYFLYNAFHETKVLLTNAASGALKALTPFPSTLRRAVPQLYVRSSGRPLLLAPSR